MAEEAPNTKPRDERSLINLTFNYSTGDHDETIPYTVRLPLFAAWDVVEVIQELGYERALTFANFVVIVANAGHSETPYPNGEELTKLRITISFLGGMFGQRLDSLEDRVLAFTYQLLRHGAMNRKGAADFAAVKLRKGNVDSSWVEAWRKRVDRWALSHNLPQVGKPRKPSARLGSTETKHRERTL